MLGVRRVVLGWVGWVEGEEPFAVTLMVVLRSDDMSEICRNRSSEYRNDVYCE